MFSWICPKCGGEVLPSETDCPRCAKPEPAPVAASEPQPVPQPSPQAAAAAPAPAPTPAPMQAPAPQQPTYVIPPPKQGLPSWVVVLLVAAVLIGAGWAGINFLRPSAQSTADAKGETKMAAPGEATKQAHPFARHLEITGLRVLETPKQKLQIQMIVVNHSSADLPDLNLEVRLRSTKSDPGAEPISTFKVRLPSLGGNESKEVKAEAATKLRAYEFPDWQFLKADFDVSE